MIKQRKVAFVTLLVIIASVVGYFLFGNTPSANPKTDRIAFLAMSSFPGLSALYVKEGIYVTNVDTGGLTQVIQRSNIEIGLTWSPQGDQIAYYDYGSRSLYTINADGLDQSKLVQQEIFVTHMDWSPDGLKIAFSNGVGKMYILDLTTKQVTPLFDEATEGSHPDWSPDSTQIVFTLNPYSNEVGSSIAIINRDGSELIQLTPNDNSTSPRWSPDGRQIVFERDRNIYVMNVDGSNIRALTQDGQSWSPTWSPDGTRIAFVSTANERCGPTLADGPRFCTSELRVMDANGSNIVVIRSKSNERVMAPVWAPRN